MSEERHNSAKTAAAILIPALVVAGGAYLSDREQAARVDERLKKFESKDERLTDLVIENTLELAELRGRALCEREQE